MRKYGRCRKSCVRRRDPSATLRMTAERVKAELLTEYMETDLKPHEIHLMSERLAEFEEAGLEPADVKVLAERDAAKVAVRKGEYKSLFYPVCGHFYVSHTGYAKENPFCEKCGQRLTTSEEAT